jgi:hypothetical protein
VTHDEQSEWSAKAEEVVKVAWDRLPRPHRNLLESIGASQWEIVLGPLGEVADNYLRSARERRWPESARAEANRAFGVWVRELRIVLIRENHPKLAGLDAPTREEFLARVAWHEWGHALSVARCSAEHVAQGEHFLNVAPPGIAKRIRDAGYRDREFTYELIAETYALLMLRRLKGGSGQPSWLHGEIYGLVKETIGWSG